MSNPSPDFIPALLISAIEFDSMNEEAQFIFFGDYVRHSKERNPDFDALSGNSLEDAQTDYVESLFNIYDFIAITEELGVYGLCGKTLDLLFGSEEIYGYSEEVFGKMLVMVMREQLNKN